MATANFKKVNASGYFVVEMNESNDWDILNEIEGRMYGAGVNGYLSNKWNRYSDAAEVLEMEETQPTIMHTELHANLKILWRPGYYADGTLDWTIEMNGHELDNYDNIEEMAQAIAETELYYWDGTPIEYNEGICKMNEPRLAQRVKTYLNELGERLDKICKEMADYTLACSGVFSNGEAIYTLA